MGTTAPLAPDVIAVVDDIDSLILAVQTCLRSSIETGEVAPLGHLGKAVVPQPPKRFSPSLFYLLRRCGLRLALIRDPGVR